MFRCKRAFITKKLIRSSKLIQLIAKKESTIRNATTLTDSNSLQFDSITQFFTQNSSHLTESKQLYNLDLDKSPPHYIHFMNDEKVYYSKQYIDFTSAQGKDCIKSLDDSCTFTSNTTVSNDALSQKLKVCLETFLKSLSDDEIETLWNALTDRTAKLNASNCIFKSSTCNTNTKCTIVPGLNLSIQLFICLHWRWPDLALDLFESYINQSKVYHPNINQIQTFAHSLAQKLKPNMYCQSIQPFDINIHTSNSIEKSKLNNVYASSLPRVCLNPNHWSKRCFIDHPPPPYKELADDYITRTDDALENQIHAKDSLAHDSLSDSTETGASEQGVGSIIPSHIKQRSKNHPLPNPRQIETSQSEKLTCPQIIDFDRGWCSLACWRYRSRVESQLRLKDPITVISTSKFLQRRANNNDLHHLQTTNENMDNLCNPSGPNLTNENFRGGNSLNDKSSTNPQNPHILTGSNINNEHKNLQNYNNPNVQNNDDLIYLVLEYESSFADAPDDPNPNFYGGQPSVYIYNESRKPIFIDSSQYAALNLPIESTSKLKVPPDHCLKLYDPLLNAYIEDPITPFPIIRLSVGKGWGPGYTRQFIESCPVWFEITLFFKQQQNSRLKTKAPKSIS